MTDVMSALIISVCSVLLIYWVVRIFWLCFSPDRIDRRTFGVIQQATNYKSWVWRALLCGEWSSLCLIEPALAGKPQRIRRPQGMSIGSEI